MWLPRPQAPPPPARTPQPPQTRLCRARMWMHPTRRSSKAAVSRGSLAFVATPFFQSSGGIAAAAATASVTQSQQAGALPLQVQNNANAAALKALTDGGLYAAADNVVVNQVNMSGTLVAGGT